MRQKWLMGGIDRDPRMGGDAVAAKGKRRDSKVERRSAYALELEYVPTEDTEGTLARTPDLSPDGCRAPGIPGEAERHEGMIKILSEGVFAYLKRKGLLGVQEDQTGRKILPGPAVMAENRHPAGNSSEVKIPDE